MAQYLLIKFIDATCLATFSHKTKIEDNKRTHYDLVPVNVMYYMYNILFLRREHDVVITGDDAGVIRFFKLPENIQDYNNEVNINI